MRITVQDYRQSGEAEAELELRGVCCKSPDQALTAIHRHLDVAKLVWPEDQELQRTYIGKTPTPKPK